MSIFSKIFKKKSENDVTKTNSNVIEIFSPLSGKIIDLSEIPDEAFAQKMIGDGIGIEPDNLGDTIYAPIDAEEISIFDTNHAVSCETKDGLELIVHFGIDTVKLNGEGFQRVKDTDTAATKGDAIVKYDLEFIKKNAKSHRTPVIISNMDMVESIDKMTGNVKPGDLIMRVYLKK